MRRLALALALLALPGCFDFDGARTACLADASCNADLGAGPGGGSGGGSGGSGGGNPAGGGAGGGGGAADAGPKRALTVRVISYDGGDGKVDVTIGSGSISTCPPTCDFAFDAGATVLLTGRSTHRVQFFGSCAAPPLTTTCSFTPTGDATVTARVWETNYAFVTSGKVVASQLGGLDGGDDFCQRAAEAAQLPGTYRALLSDSTTDAFDRFKAFAGWLSVDERPLSVNATDFYYPLLTEDGGFVSDEDVITGSDRSWRKDGGNCQDWRGDAGTWQPGVAGGGATIWLRDDFASRSCDSAGHLYCLEADEAATISPPPAPPPGALLVFLSDFNFVPGAGLPAANATCAFNTSFDAGQVVALLASGTSSIQQLVNLSDAGLDAPLVRSDHVVVVDHARDLFRATPTLRAPIDHVSDGQQSNSAYVLTGATDPVSPPSGRDCAGWTSDAGNAQTGDLRTTGGRAFNYQSSFCSTGARLYCVQVK